MQFTDAALGYIAYDKGTIAPNGNISATLTDTNGSTGTWTMTRITTPTAGDLTVNVVGSSVVRVTGGHRIACSDGCSQTFHLRAGSRVVVTPAATNGWKFTAWSGSCKGSVAVCALRLRRPVSVSVTFVPPGARLNPIPLAQLADVGNGWRVEIASTVADATQAILAATDPYGQHRNSPPPAGAQDFLVSLTLTYTGGGKGNLYSLVDMLHAVGSHNAPYDMGDDPCGVFLPAPDLGNQGAGDVFSGRTVTGNVCFQIASNDADSLLLDVGDPLVGNNHWFAPR
jgi:hypothetical protein